MEHLFKSWSVFSSALETAPRVLLLSDYDGTLTPIVGRPEDAVLSPAVRDKLRVLSQKSNYSVGIVSGRSLSETRSMVAIDGIYYAGNHGLEIEGPGIDYLSPLAELARKTMKNLAGQLAEALDSFAGVIIQNKGLSLSVHYRLVKEAEEGRVADIFNRITAPLADEGEIKITSGKKVLEVRPPIDWDKGKAVEVIRREIIAALKIERVLTIYMGDDETDEDAFKVLQRPEGWSIFVGKENTASSADYYLASTAEVAEFLSRLIKMK